MDAINGVTGLLPAGQAAATPLRQAESSFGDILTAMVGQTNTLQQAADQAIQQVHAGDDKNLHSAMIAMEKADISLRYMVQVRNKAIDAYQEIMRMQV